MVVYTRQNANILWAILLGLILASSLAILVVAFVLRQKSLEVEKQLERLELDLKKNSVSSALVSSNASAQVVLTGFSQVSAALDEDSLERDLRVRVNGQSIPTKVSRPSKGLVVSANLDKKYISPNTSIEVSLRGLGSPIFLNVPREQLINGGSEINIFDQRYLVSKN
ncbi:MAG: hypothetical protein ACK4NS_04790 [Saprospiraceae bacterium]